MIPSTLPVVSAISPAANVSGDTWAGPEVSGGALPGTFSRVLDAASATADAHAAASVDPPHERASQQEPDPGAKTRDDTECNVPAADGTALLLAELQALHAPSTAVAAASGTAACEPKAAALRGPPSADDALVMASLLPDSSHEVLLASGRQEPHGTGTRTSNPSRLDMQATAAALAPAGTGELAAATQRDNGLAVVTLPPQAQMPALPPFAATLGAATTVHEGRLAATPGSADFAGQLGTQLTTFVREGVQHARLQLNPAELGPVTVRIQLDGQAAQVHLTAEHALTRQALEQSMPTLAGSLREAGLTLSGGGVFDQPRQRGGNPADPSSSGPRQPRGSDRDTETPLRSLTAARSRRGVVDLVA